MIWKNWPYWVRGGIITILVMPVLILIAAVSDYFLSLHSKEISIGGIIGMLLVSPMYVLIPFLGVSVPTILFSLLGFLFYFLIGAVIGCVYSNVKGRFSKLTAISHKL